MLYFLTVVSRKPLLPLLEAPPLWPVVGQPPDVYDDGVVLLNGQQAAVLGGETPGLRRAVGLLRERIVTVTERRSS